MVVGNLLLPNKSMWREALFGDTACMCAGPATCAFFSFSKSCVPRFCSRSNVKSLLAPYAMESLLNINVGDLVVRSMLEITSHKKPRVYVSSSSAAA
jgi:hypothetical protein